MISINIYEIMMQMLNFTILLVLINKYLVKPLGGFLKNRAEGIEKSIQSATHDKEASSALLAQQKELLKQARTEAHQIRLNAEASSKKEKEMMLAKVKDDSSRLMETSKKEIDLDVKKAEKELVGRMGQLSIMLSERILKRSISDEDKDRIVSDSLEMLKQK